MSNLEWLPTHTILYVRHGSHAYGTNIATSDEDYRGICIPPSRYRSGFLNHFEQSESKSPDVTIFEIRKWFKLACECNPNVLEMIFTDESDVIHNSYFGKKLRGNRNQFLTKRAKHTYSGYAMAQLKRIKTHYAWIMHPPTREPLRSDYELPERTLIPVDQLKAAEAMVQKKMDEWNVHVDELEPAQKIQIQSILTEVELSKTDAARAIGFSDNFIYLLDQERRYTAARTTWTQYLNWKATRNPARAELEAKHGYDTKHAMHLVRLMRMGEEILSGKGCIVKRPDAEELLSIRAGEWTYERLVEWATEQDAHLTKIYAISPLPREPDRVKLDELCQYIVEGFSA